VAESLQSFRFEIDHIIAEQHHGLTVFSNLALACPRCNRCKGPNLSGIDSESGAMVRLFHPRNDAWGDHFLWIGPQIVGRTSIGRVTIDVLQINHTDSLRLRSALIAEGLFPPA
jgi:hypothetical protein